MVVEFCDESVRDSAKYSLVSAGRGREVRRVRRTCHVDVIPRVQSDAGTPVWLVGSATEIRGKKQRASAAVQLSNECVAPEGDSAAVVRRVICAGGFREAGLSIAMGNATENVKKAATCVTKSNTEDGFAWAIDNIILKTSSDGTIVKLKDVGRAELGAEAYGSLLEFNGHDAVGLGITQLSNANALEVDRAALAELERLSKNFPPGMKVQVAFDTTNVVSATIPIPSAFGSVPIGVAVNPATNTARNPEPCATVATP